MPAGDGLVEGQNQFMETTDLHPMLGAIVTASPSGKIMVGVMNTKPEAVTIQAGTRYGSFRRIIDQNYHDKKPWRVAVMKGKHVNEDTFIERTDPKDFDNLPTWMKGPTTDENVRARMGHFIKVFGLDKSPALKEKKQIVQAARLLANHWQVFSFDGSYGRTTLLKHQINTPPGYKPINQKFRPINPTVEADLKKQVDQWLKHKVIEKSQSPWNFGLVAAPKKNGKIRWCVDYRELNKITEKDTHPIGNIDDNLARLSKSVIFSGIDGSGAFHVIELEDKDKPKTAFATPWGSYQFITMPFGLCGAPSTYARLVQLVINGNNIPYSVALPYLDDTVIHSKNFQEHLGALDQVLKAHHAAGLKLQPDKCQMFKDSIEYLGHIISERGIAPMDDYVKVVKDWPMPRTKNEARVFLGKTGYYRRFIKNYSALAAPLSDLTAKVEGRGDHDSIKITPQMETAFNTLKQKLIEAPILAYPQFDSKEPFILDTDWSQENNAIGAVLSQKQGGEERVIAYAGSKLTKAQANYSSMKGELAAAIVMMRKFRYHLQLLDIPFILRIDNAALKWIYTMEAPIGMIQRWLDTLANFNFVVEHRAGTSHGNADSLSRAPHLVENTSCDLDLAQGERIGSMGPYTKQLTNLITSLDEQTQWTPEWLRQGQEEDEDLNQIRKWVAAGDKPTDLQAATLSRQGKIYAGLFDSLSLDDNGILRYEMTFGQDIGIPETRRLTIVPEPMRQEAINQAHEAVAHMGTQATLHRLQKNIWFPHMLKWTEDFVGRCQVCQTKKGGVKDQRHTLVSHVTGYPFQKLSIDFVGPLPKSTRGNLYMLTIEDTFSRWLEAFPCKRATAKFVADILTTEIFPRYGVCDQIHSDRGSQFLSHLVREVALDLGIRQSSTPAYNPKSNPVERQHRTLGAAIISLSEGNQHKWEEMLPHALFAMRTSRCRTTGVAPFEALFGRDASTSLDLVFGNPPLQQDNYDNMYDYTRALRNRIGAAHAWARQNMDKALCRQRKAYFKDKKSYEVGQSVWLWTPRLKPGQSKKFAIYWTGPWEVEQKINDVMYLIKPSYLWSRKKSETVSIDRLKPFLSQYLDNPDLHQPPEDDADLRMAGDEFAEFQPQVEPEEDDEVIIPGVEIPHPPEDEAQPINIAPPAGPDPGDQPEDPVEPQVQLPRRRGRPLGARNRQPSPIRPAPGEAGVPLPPYVRPLEAPNALNLRPVQRRQWNDARDQELARRRTHDDAQRRDARILRREEEAEAALHIQPPLLVPDPDLEPGEQDGARALPRDAIEINEDNIPHDDSIDDFESANDETFTSEGHDSSMTDSEGHNTTQGETTLQQENVAEGNPVPLVPALAAGDQPQEGGGEGLDVLDNGQQRKQEEE